MFCRKVVQNNLFNKMKIKLTLFVLIISVTMVVAQNEIALNTKISFDMPKGTVKFEDAENVRKLKGAFGDEIAQTLRKNTTVFRYENIVFRFKVVDNAPANFIQNSGKALDNVYGKDTQTMAKSKEKLYKGYSKNSRNLDNGKVVFAVYQEENKSVLNFSYYSSAKSVAFGGRIVYDANDREEVRQIFDKLCNSIIIN
jgi:hypothetical protein